MAINATFLGFLAILFWSTSIGLMRTVTEALGPGAGAALIYTLSGLLIILFRGWPRCRRFSKIYLYGCGLTFILYEIFLSQSIGYAQDRAQTMEITLLNYCWPCLTVAMAIWFKLQPSQKLIWLGIALAFLGIAYSLTEGNLAQLSDIRARLVNNPMPYVLALSAACLWALFCCITKRYGRGEDGTSLFLLVVGMTLWVKYLAFDRQPLSVNLSVSMQVLALSLATALGYSFWNVGIQKGNLLLLSIFSYFTPLLALFWASIWLQLPLSFPFWCGVVLVIVGSLICFYASRRATT